jgi:hypothetical protein
VESGSKRGRVQAFFAAVILVGCGGAAQPAVNPESAATSSDAQTANDDRAPPKDKPRFAWPVSRAVPVVETSTKGAQHSAEARYFVQICPAPNARRSIEIVDFRLVTLNGGSTKDPRVAAAAEATAPFLAAIPAFVVESTGEVVSAEGFDEMFVNITAKFARKGVERLRPVFETERGREILQEAAFARWRSWVETWLIYDPEFGPDIEVTTDILGTPEKTLLSFDGWKGTHAMLSFEMEFSKEGARSLIGWIMEAVGVKQLDEKTLESAELLQNAQIETDWPEIRPHWVRHEKNVRLTVAGELKERTQTHEYRFDWANSKAVSCKPRSAGR